MNLQSREKRKSQRSKKKTRDAFSWRERAAERPSRTKTPVPFVTSVRAVLMGDVGKADWRGVRNAEGKSREMVKIFFLFF